MCKIKAMWYNDGGGGAGMIHFEGPGRVLSVSGGGKLPFYLSIYHLNLIITFANRSANSFKFSLLKEQCGTKCKLIVVHFFG